MLIMLFNYLRAVKIFNIICEDIATCFITKLDADKFLWINANPGLIDEYNYLAYNMRIH
ncbi:hypothetical protein C3B55_00056 [Candidatus Pseudomonas adelgestsugas]|uniref:Uncharacterized protein n=1 Tax=Candidatus Pseudomonas adelgestsugas TaxID=1302376 RepID=A0ABX5R712_9PSED|nr:hypothetical protein C3B55_00056 [Candidatus Pseudomonas adelgestsugas]